MAFDSEFDTNHYVYAYLMRPTSGGGQATVLLFRDIDFTFHPETRRIYANDNGVATCDELIVVDKGQNYGWPQSLGQEGCHNPDAVEPVFPYTKLGKRPEVENSNVGPPLSDS